MKWFKHQTSAHRNKSIIKLVNRYGTDGYAIYFYCLELIACDVGYGHGQPDPTFDLKQDAESVGIALKVDQIRVEEIMVYMVNLGLFEDRDGVITCYKIAKYLEKKNTRNKGIHAAIDSAKKDEERRGTFPDLLEPSPLEVEVEVEVEEPKDNSVAKRDSTRFKVPTIEEVAEYIAEKQYKLDAEAFWHHYEARGWILNNGKQMKKWKSAVVTWKKNNAKFGGNTAATANNDKRFML